MPTMHNFSMNCHFAVLQSPPAQIQPSSPPVFKNSHCRLIELCTLSTPEDIRAGKVLVGTNYSAHEHHPVYTPESYAKHLQHILELVGYTGIRRTKTQLQIKELIQELRR